MKSAPPPTPPIGRGEPIQEDVSNMILQLRRRLREGRLMTFREWLQDVSELLRLLR